MVSSLMLRSADTGRLEHMVRCELYPQGAPGRPMAVWPALPTLAEALDFKLADVLQLGDDLRIRAHPVGSKKRFASAENPGSA